MMLEVQLTKEYLEFATHRVYLAPQIEEVLRSDTYAAGAGSTARKASTDRSSATRSRQWRELPTLGPIEIGPDRIRSGELVRVWSVGLGYRLFVPSHRRGMGTDDLYKRWPVVGSVKAIMMASREAAANYMTPLGLVHQMSLSHLALTDLDRYGKGRTSPCAPLASKPGRWVCRASEAAHGHAEYSSSQAPMPFAPATIDRCSDAWPHGSPENHISGTTVGAMEG